MNCFLRELGKQITNIGENIEHDTSLDNYSNRIFIKFFSSHIISVGENVEVGIVSKKG